ncbi:hypothetical protein PP304_gp193 [Gordonia phage Phendrix]|uniref:Uncharacterized protein n=1 Tax=Gordonia phage Phendrix TaxID=2593335 RepID=A0A514U147_9CAUD|nr:hypothetical protein PP304_gp193 [Gordonia phage Phendrix]QDK02677.1 hypothetical protein SEA_PHENDRIX_160 [Gordonia phage Phendrix]
MTYVPKIGDQVIVDAPFGYGNIHTVVGVRPFDDNYQVSLENPLGTLITPVIDSSGHQTVRPVKVRPS